MNNKNVSIDRKLFPLLTTILEVSNRFFNVLIFVYIADISFFFTVQLMYCLMVHTTECWIKHELFLCACLFLLATRITFLINSRGFSKVRARITSELVWDLDIEDPVKLLTIIKKRKVFICYFVVQCLVVFGASVPTMQELILHVDKISVPVGYIKHHYPLIFTPLIWFGVVDNIVSVWVITLFPIYLYYCCELVEMQIIILRWKIEEFREQLKSQGARSGFVKMGLKNIVKQHHNLLRCNTIMREHMGTPQIIVYFAVFPCTIFITLLLCSNQVSIFLKCATSLSHIFIGVSSYHKGQLSCNLIQSMCFELYDLEWYDWDESDMKTCLILIANSSKQLNWSSITQSKAFNYETLKEVLKVFYTMYSFLRSNKH